MKRSENRQNREKTGARLPLPALSFSKKRLALIALILAAVFCPAVCPAVCPVPVGTAAAVSDFMLPFTDVPDDAWFYEDVAAAYDNGLVNGKSASLYAPYDGILLSEAVKLAACLHERTETGSVTLRNGADVWYSAYTAYAAEHGILYDDADSIDWSAPGTRGEIMEFFSRAASFDGINEVPDGAVPDVPMTHPHAEAVYALYRAGIVQGSDTQTHIFRPDEYVTRAEVAATLTRLTDPAARLRFSMNGADGADGAEDPGTDPESPDPGDGGTEPIPSEESAPGETEADPAGEIGLSAPGRTYSDLTLRWAAVYEERFGEGSSDGLLLDSAGIDAYNAAIAASCPTVVNPADYPSRVSGGAVANLILGYAIPEGYDYTRNGVWIGQSERDAVLANRALKNIPETVEVRYAVVTGRCDLKSFPMADGFYSYGASGLNKAQETELSVGMPVAVLHRSADGIYLFVQAYHYAGWIPAWSCAFCGSDTFRQFALRSPEAGITVTSSVVTVNGVRLDMGVYLPCIGETENGYEVLLPLRGTDGTYAETVALLSRSDAVRGRLPYTMKNFYEQAFRYLGTPYGWGGADGGVDCSGFVCCVMRSFGIMIPRNTTEQRYYSGASTDVSAMSGSERAGLLASSRYPIAIHRQGHVMLYLGESDGLMWIVHAHGIGQPVCVASLDPGSAMLRMVELYR